MSVDSKMTAIADKIRGLLGLTGDMGLDAMATNLTTEQANITAALAALTEKGVTVPAGSTSNALAGLIAAIEASGGTKFTTGTVTFDSEQNVTSTNGYLVEHNLGVIPKGLFLYVGTAYTTATSYTKVISEFITPALVIECYYASYKMQELVYTTGDGLDMASFADNKAQATETTMNILFPHGHRISGAIGAGVTLYWVIWG